MSRHYFGMFLANHIASICNLPGLFLGTYRDVTIEYIHYSHHLCKGRKIDRAIYIVIKSNRWRRALRIDNVELEWREEISPLIELPGDDFMFDLFKRYRTFPSEQPAERRVFRLSTAFLFQGGTQQHLIWQPDTAPEPSRALNQAFIRLRKEINAQIDNPSAYLSATENYDNLANQDIKKLRTFFMRRYAILARFGQSGLFGQSEAPHDTEYILTILDNVNRCGFYFVKTSTFFRGIRQNYGETYRSGKDMILDCEVLDVDWVAMIDAVSQLRRLPRRDKLRGDLFVEFGLPETDTLTIMYENDIATYEDVACLWQAVQALIVQFPEDI